MSLEMTDAGVISMPVELPGDFEDETAYAYCPGRSTCFMTVVLRAGTLTCKTSPSLLISLWRALSSRSR
jgi:hypothetical protein